MAATKLCCVVGLGGGGIGEHVAMRFAKEGYNVAMLARTKSSLDKLEKEIPNSKGYVCDASDSKEVHATVEAIVKDHDTTIDALIYNAGLGAFKSFDETSEELFEACWRSGPMGFFSFAKAVIPGMLAKKSGVIGVTGATASWRGMPSTVAFAPAKFAMRACAQSLARDMGPKGIHVFHVAIDGIVDMPKTRLWMENKPDEEFMHPADIAETYWNLANQPRSAWSSEVNLAAHAAYGSIATI